MKKQFRILALITLVVLTTTACDNTKDELAKEDKLRSYMLGGMYFINGYGGSAETEKLAEELGNNDQSELIDTYTQLFVLPFGLDEGDDTREVLSKWWNINNKEELIASLERLSSRSLNPDNPHKAWDYARAVNNICLAYASGFLTAEEADSRAAEVLISAKADFQNWEAYMTDFLEGRKIWNPNDKRDMKIFVEIVEEILDSSESIYKSVNLN